MAEYEKLSLHLLAMIAGCQVRILTAQKNGNANHLTVDDLAGLERHLNLLVEKLPPIDL